MNIIKLNIQNSGLSILTSAIKDNIIRDVPATDRVLLRIFVYELVYAISSTTRHISPQNRRNIGEA